MTRKRIKRYTLAMSANSELFNEALQQQQSKKNDEAIKSYLKLLDQGQLTQEQTSLVSHNLSTLYKKIDQLPLAYVYNQKAIYSNSRNSAAESFLKTELSQYQPQVLTIEPTLLNQIDAFGLKFLPLELIFVFLISAFGIWLKLTFHILTERKRKFIQNQLQNSLGYKFYLFGFLTVFLATLFFLKNNQILDKKGIVKVETAQVQTSAGFNQAVITEIHSGQIVQIIQTETVDGISYIKAQASGAFTGWIKAEFIEVF